MDLMRVQSFNLKMQNDPLSTKGGMDPQCIADNITLYDWETFKSMQPVELLNQCWTKDKLKHRCPNVLKIISRFNELSGWSASNILWQEKLSKRAKMYCKFIQIAKCLFDMGNFHSSMAIVAGLNQACILRLKYTVALAPKGLLKTLSILETKLSAIGSYREYRATIKSIAPPVIPYIGVYLTDLIFIEEGNPDEIDGLINFHKRRLIHNVLVDVRQYQQLGYVTIQSDPILTSFLKQLPFIGEKELFDLSLLREPRGAAKEDIF